MIFWNSENVQSAAAAADTDDDTDNDATDDAADDTADDATQLGQPATSRRITQQWSQSR